MELNHLIKRIERLEKAVFGELKKSSEEGQLKNDQFSGPTGGVRLLISKNYFSEKRSLADTRSELAGLEYHYSSQAINKGLNSLSSNKGPLVKLKEKGNNVYVNRR